MTSTPNLTNIIRRELTLARQAVALGMLSEARNVQALEAELAKAEA